jgi:hypothetical protein
MIDNWEDKLEKGLRIATAGTFGLGIVFGLTNYLDHNCIDAANCVTAGYIGSGFLTAFNWCYTTGRRLDEDGR